MPKGSDIGQMMLDGELAATLQGVDLPKDPRVEYLVPDPFEAAKDWYAREGVVCINHLFVVHESLSRERPDVVREIFRMLVESRAATEGGVPAVYPPIGLEANRKGIQLAIDWALEQKIIPRRIEVDDLFDEVTAGLGPRPPPSARCGPPPRRSAGSGRSRPGRRWPWRDCPRA
jgi:4,5-dihydroxyphthalate decarboxylase